MWASRRVVQALWAACCPQGILLMIATWPAWRLGIAVGLDPSWNTALVMAHVERLRFGRDIGYTYGPLGYLAVPSAFSLSSVVGAVWYAALGGACLAYATLESCARRFGRFLGLAAASALMLAAPLDFFAPELYSIGLILTVCLVAQRQIRASRIAFIAVIGAAAALQTLVKPTAGALATIALMAAISMPGPKLRALGAGVGAYLAGFMSFWLMEGQRLSDMPAWARVILARIIHEAA